MANDTRYVSWWYRAVLFSVMMMFGVFLTIGITSQQPIIGAAVGILSLVAVIRGARCARVSVRSPCLTSR